MGLEKDVVSTVCFLQACVWLVRLRVAHMGLQSVLSRRSGGGGETSKAYSVGG